MKAKLILVLLTILSLLIPQDAWGGCDWKTNITPESNGNYSYTKDCHIKVGQTVQDNKVKDEKISDLTKAITLKDLSLQDSDNRAKLWNDTAIKLEDRVQKLDSMEKHNGYLYFAAGVLATVLTGFMAARLIGK